MNRENTKTDTAVAHANALLTQVLTEQMCNLTRRATIRMGNPDDGNDVVSETMEIVLRKLLTGYIPAAEDDIRRMLWYVMEQKATERLRQRSRRSSRTFSLEQWQERDSRDEGGSLHEIPSENDVEETVFSHLEIRRLAGEHWLLFVLRFEYCLDHATIARLVGKTPTAVRTMINRIQHSIAAHLGNDLPSSEPNDPPLTTSKRRNQKTRS